MAANARAKTFLSMVAGIAVCLHAAGARALAAEEKETGLMAKVPSVKEIAAMLPARPKGFGRPITDRESWNELAKVRSYQRTLAKAESLLKKPFPETSDELYLDFSRTGNRTRWQGPNGARRSWINTLTVAECVENKGRFLPRLEEAIAAICAERTWVMPAHDHGLANFHGKRIDIDLGSATLSWNLATAHYLLGRKLKPKARKEIEDNVRRRILAPYVAMATGRRRRNWWMNTTNNWNAVCLAGVTGSALAMTGSRDERARFVGWAMKFSKNFLRGFTPDGYCTEGLGYWNYGFGNFTALAEMVHQATSGRIDLLGQPAARMPAMFPDRIGITDGLSPAFADCHVFAKPSRPLQYFLRRRFGLGGSAKGDARLLSAGGHVAIRMMYSFPNSATALPMPKAKAPAVGVRTWFEQAGVLIARPGKGSSCRIGVALKGGHNAEHHNHNDVGSYVVVLGKRPVLVDPGGEVYTARTFSGRRYDSNVLNSFGHPVPRVAGRLQSTGRKAQARVLKAEFTDEADTLVLDIRSAYGVKPLKALTRTFVYSRAGAGSLTVTDEVVFGTPQTFETALLTLGTWEKLGPRSLKITDAGQSVRVDFMATGVALAVEAEQIKEHLHIEEVPTRIALRFKKPVTEASISVTITPVSQSQRRD